MPNLSPIDGRYRSRVEPIRHVAGDAALLSYRAEVELRWLFLLTDILPAGRRLSVSPQARERLLGWAGSLGDSDVEGLLRMERLQTRHDMRALEVLLAEALHAEGCSHAVSLLHLGCTSEDSLNLAYRMLAREAIQRVWHRECVALVVDLARWAAPHSSTPILAMTHGQPATPTTLGKEMAVYTARWRKLLEKVSAVRLTAKFGGSTGNLAALAHALPGTDWLQVSQRFVESLGFEFNPITTQVEPGDTLAELLDLVVRFNTAAEDFAVDVWLYGSRGLIRFDNPGPLAADSSAMPHKSNPFLFEQAEGNFGFSSAILKHIANATTRSRLQRDLSSSTVLRNLGLGVAHSYLGATSLRDGIAASSASIRTATGELDQHWEVLSEALRAERIVGGEADNYAEIRRVLRGAGFSEDAYRAAVSQVADTKSSGAPKEVVGPSDYVGYSGLMAEQEFDAVTSELDNPRTKPD